MAKTKAKTKTDTVETLAEMRNDHANAIKHLREKIAELAGDRSSRGLSKVADAEEHIAAHEDAIRRIDERIAALQLELATDALPQIVAEIESSGPSPDRIAKLKNALSARRRILHVGMSAEAVNVKIDRLIGAAKEGHVRFVKGESWADFIPRTAEAA